MAIWSLVIQWTPSNLTTLGTRKSGLIRGGVATFLYYFGNLHSGLNTGVATFQGFRLEGVHCILRCLEVWHYLVWPLASFLLDTLTLAGQLVYQHEVQYATYIQAAQHAAYLTTGMQTQPNSSQVSSSVAKSSSQNINGLQWAFIQAENRQWSPQ